MEHRKEKKEERTYLLQKDKQEKKIWETYSLERKSEYARSGEGNEEKCERRSTRCEGEVKGQDRGMVQLLNGRDYTKFVRLFGLIYRCNLVAVLHGGCQVSLPLPRMVQLRRQCHCCGS